MSDWKPPRLKGYSPEEIGAAFEEVAKDIAAPEGDAEWFRLEWLARKSGRLTKIREAWFAGAQTSDEKRRLGLEFNRLKLDVERQLAALEGLELGEESTTADATAPALASILRRKRDEERIAAEALDISLPGIPRPLGVEHPITRTMNEIVQVFKSMGYSVAEGPEIETDYYNFESLNFPLDHPARDMQDTIFLAGQDKKPQRERLLLRTHTSPVQMRTMEKQKPPVRIVVPGRVYRNDAPDATHSPMFHQVEGLAVDTNITFRDLKGTLDHAMKALFGSGVRTRFRPSFFPFTEPSAEVLVSCIFCGGSGFQGTARCPVCKQSGWIELLGAGMVDPALYGFCGYDAQKISGFAFGMGVDRIAALRWGISDLQLFFQGDVRFLEQFA